LSRHVHVSRARVNSSKVKVTNYHEDNSLSIQLVPEEFIHTIRIKQM